MQRSLFDVDWEWEEVGEKFIENWVGRKKKCIMMMVGDDNMGLWSFNFEVEVKTFVIKG